MSNKTNKVNKVNKVNKGDGQANTSKKASTPAAQQGSGQANTPQSKSKKASTPAAQQGIQPAAGDEKVAKIIGTITEIIAVVVIIALFGYITVKHQDKNPDKGVNLSWYTTAIDNVQTKPEGVSDTYGFNISKNGYNNPVKGVPTVGVYMDFMCPGCGNFERQNSGNLERMANAGQINVEYHFMNFLDQASSDKYSTRAANAAIYIAQKDPGHLLKFVSKMMSEGVQPEENSGSTPSNADIVKYAEGVGIPKDVAKASVKAGYSDWISAVNTYTTKRPSLYNLSGDYAGKSMSTPAITVNGKLIDMVKAGDKGIADDAALLKSLGIDKIKVGAKDYKIGLGATGEPIPFK